jgi:IS5 family transposase
MPGPTNNALEDLAPKTVFIAGRQEPHSKRTSRRLRRYRTGAEGRISHLKRRYGLDRSRLKGDDGQQIWTEWGILAYNATRSPSGPGETLRKLSRPEQIPITTQRPREITPRPFRLSSVFPREVI